MRLKTLFFPLMLVISISIFAGYIWPEITRLRAANEVNIAKNKELQDVNIKKGAIESLGKQISNSDSEKIIRDYLPQVRMEENVIGNVNYLANSANVSLVNISLGGGNDDANDRNNVSAGVAGILNPIARASAAIDETAVGAVEQSALRATSAEISVIGEYEKVRIFLDGLNRISIFNNIKSLTISKPEKSKEDGAVDSNNNVLSVAVVVDFGYMPVSKLDGQKVLAFKSNIDDGVVEILKNYVSQKYSFSPTSGDAKGRVNPFLTD